MARQSIHFLGASAMLFLGLFAGAVRAQTPCTFDSDIQRQVVEYWHAASPPAREELRCTGKDCSMSGYILTSKTDTKGNKPAILFLHGSAGTTPVGQVPMVSNTYVCTLANYFIPRGYVIFMPYMRGYGDDSASLPPTSSDPHKNSGFINTGTDYQDWAAQQSSAHSQSWWFLDYMQVAEMNDIQESLTHLVGMKAGDGSLMVNPAKIAISGHSFGGARLVLAAASHLTPLPRAALDLSGAAMSWTVPGGADWGTWLVPAAGNREMPLYNHMNTLENLTGNQGSALDVFNSADNAQGVGEAVMMIYSQFAIPAWFHTKCQNGGIPDYWCAHSWFISSTEQSARWLPHVEAFLDRAGF